MPYLWHGAFGLDVSNRENEHRKTLRIVDDVDLPLRRNVGKSCEFT